jgi:hypothetical protein
MRRFIAFGIGVVTGLFFGWVPAELIVWLRGWSTRWGTQPTDDEPSDEGIGKRKRGRQYRRR